MTFRSKVDRFFIVTIGIIIFILAVAILFPLLFQDARDDSLYVIILISLFIMSTVFILWSSFSITYTFEEDHLFVKGGFLRSRIPYENITKVKPTTSIWYGYRMLSAKNALEIFYKYAMFGSVKVSPKHQAEFMTLLKEKCPNMEVEYEQ